MAIQKEKCFPRGGKKLSVKTKIKRRNKQVQLFDLGKKKVKSKKKTIRSQDLEENQYAVAESLSYRSLVDGMTLLACVIGVTDYHVRLSLPGRLVGKVTIANISGPYSKILRFLLEKKEVSETYYDLKQMFQPGQFVVAKVLTVAKCEDQNRYKVHLTLDPASINSNYSHSLVKSGMVLQGAVKSIEDHGYVMDFGIKSLTAFLKSENAETFISHCNGGRQLGIGQVLFCRMLNSPSPGTTVVQVTSNPREVSSSFEEYNNQSIATLSPGTLVKSLVVESISDGIMVEFWNFKGLIHRDHIGEPQPRVADFCQARVLYSVPLLNTVYLSHLLGNKSLLAGYKDKSALKVGQIVTNAIVKSVSRRGVTISLGKYKGYIARNRLSDKEVHPDEMKELYSAGMELDVRIIGNDKMEGVFICSAQKNTMDQKYFSVGDMKPGMKVSGIVMAMKGNGLTVQVNNSNGLEGYVPLTQLADFPVRHPEKRFPSGKRVNARVLKVIEDKGNFLLTLKPSLVDSELPILDKCEEAESLGIADGTIFKILDSGLVVVFYNGIKGFASIHDTGLSSGLEPSSLNEVFFEGQTVRCRIIGYNAYYKRLKLSLLLNTNGDPEILSRLGDHFALKVTEVTEEELVVKIDKAANKDKFALKGSRCIIPVSHLSDYASLTESLLKTYKAGDTIPSAVFFSLRDADNDEQCTAIFSLRQSAIEFQQTFKFNKAEELELDDNRSEEDHKSDAPRIGSGSLEKGSVIPCSILKPIVEGLILEAPLPHERRLIVPLRLVSDEYLESINKQTFTEHRLIFGKVLQSKIDNTELILSTKLSELWNGYDLEPSLNLVKNYLSAVGCIRERMTSQGKSQLSRFVEGQKVEGTVKSICSKGRASIKVHRIIGVKGKMKPVMAIVTPHHYRKKPINIGDKVVGLVIFVDYGEGHPYLTLNCKTMEEVEGAADESMAVGKCIRAEILLKAKDVVVALVKGNLYHGKLIYLPVQNHCNDFCGFKELETPLSPGDIHKVIVSGKEDGKVIGLLKKKVTLQAKYNDSKVKHPRKRRADHSKTYSHNSFTEDSSLQPVKRRKEEVESDDRTLRNCDDVSDSGNKSPLNITETVDSGDDSKQRSVDTMEVLEASTDKVTTLKDHSLVVDVEEQAKSSAKGPLLWENLPRLQVDEGFTWNMDILSLPSAFSSQQDASDDSSGEEDGKDEFAVKEKKGKKRKGEMVSKKAREEEIQVREAEENAMDMCPQTASDFDRLVLSSPDSSIVWLKYIAFHLQNTEIEKARAVAQRALKTINFREEQEKFNIWVSLLNLENLYGTKESLEKVFQDALQMNDALRVYFQMLQIYLDSKKMEDLDSLMEVMLKKYKSRKEAWIQAGAMCMKANRADKASELLRRSFKSLAKRDHVEVICRWAQLEARCESGSVERAQSLLEGVLASCPKRTDVWSSLVDTLAKAGHIEGARNVLERAISQNLPVRKMKVLFKKFLSFEESHGTPESAARVRQLAVDYVEKGLAT